MILHIPHSSRFIPDDARSSIRLSDADLAQELLRMTDAFTDELFRTDMEQAVSIVFPVSRLVVDPERFLDDGQEVMASKGMGVIYTRTSEEKFLRDPPTETERADLIHRFYVPHHRRLENAVKQCLDDDGKCLIVDCHSFPSRALPYELDQDITRPDICLGTDRYHTPGWLVAYLASEFRKAGFSVGIDKPFSGTMVPMACYGKNPSVRAVMIEVKRSLYMDESSGEKKASFLHIAHTIHPILNGLTLQETEMNSMR